MEKKLLEAFDEKDNAIETAKWKKSEKKEQLKINNFQNIKSAEFNIISWLQLTGRQK